MNEMERNVRIDLIKGISIILMVIGHSGAPSFTSFIYLFHMAIFFIASGYLYDHTYSNSIQSLSRFIKRKVKSLWFPFVLWNTIFSILHNFFIDVNVYTNNEMFLVYGGGKYNQLTQYWNINDIIKCSVKSIFFASDVQIGGAFWFFKILFVLSIMYASLEYIWVKIYSNNDSVIFQTILSILLLFVGYYFSIKNINIFSIQIVFSCYCLYHLGVLFKYKKENVGWQLKKMSVPPSRLHLILLISSFGLLIIFSNYGSISLGSNFYPNPIFMLLSSFLGWVFVSEIAYYIEKSDMCKRCFIIVGNETRSIMVLHFLCFKIISYFIVICKNRPYYLVASFPVIREGTLWWVAYTIIGIVLPIFLHKLWNYYIKKLFSFKDKAEL